MNPATFCRKLASSFPFNVIWYVVPIAFKLYTLTLEQFETLKMSLWHTSPFPAAEQSTLSVSGSYGSLLETNNTCAIIIEEAVQSSPIDI